MFPKSFLTVFLFESVIIMEAARILAYYPGASISHQVVFRPITLELLKRGHQVTVITSDPIFSDDNRPDNLTEIDVHDMSYNIIINHFTTTIAGEQDVIRQFEILTDVQLLLLEEQFKSQAVRDLLMEKRKEYDLVLLESIFLPALGLIYKFNAPTILVSSFGAFPHNYEAVGVSTNPFIYPDASRQRLYNLTVWEKVKEVYNHVRMKNVMIKHEVKSDELMKKLLGPDVPSINILKNNVDMLFLNINPIWEGNYPVPPNVIHMGGLHLSPPKELPKDLQKYLDASKEGVIYFSLGTNVKPSLLPAQKIAIFEKVFSQLPYNVIWKWDSEDFTPKSANIRVLKWLPQADLLRHPNVKVFITQGGLQSTDEAIMGGVPLIGIPMLGDQWYNVEKYVYHKIGVRLDLEGLTEDQLRAAIHEVAEVESYRSNIKRLRTLTQDQPQTPLERTIWWIEYVLRHGGAKHLRAPAANMTWTEFLELELVAFLITAAVASLGLIVVTIKFILKLNTEWSTSKLKKS